MTTVAGVLGQSDTAYDIGYVTGSVIAALVVGYLIMWVWGLVRNDGGNRRASATAWANHWRTLLASGVLFFIFVVGAGGGT